ncbi:hypothetical protein PAXINDRAFT_160454 [Paxillus involutus ATCC 200175]|nr:hypothetical protein PAXINDRAFT_160454 [Paxillus involutus ATCC 200175]
MEYQRHHAYGIQPSGEVSICTTFVSSQPSTSSQTTDPPDASHDIWSELAHIDEHLEPELDTMNNNKKRTAGWIPERSAFLDEIIRLEGQGHADFSCCACNSGEAPVYQCKDCFGVQLLCAACILSRHASNPLHRIEEWQDSHFRRITLKSMGLCIQLGHTLGKKCYNAQPASGDDFVVIDMNGIHEIALDYCASPSLALVSCYNKRPRTAATFSVLKNFHLLSLESKVSAYEYYHSLARLTDNTGLSDIRWRHLKQLKRTGRGQDPNGIEATKEGECAIKCPACPHPGINLLDGWRDVGHTNWWIYALFVAIDADFRLKRKAVSNNIVDPGLNRGWAYIVDEQSYKEYLNERVHEAQEKSTCVSHNAVNMADTKTSRGLAAMGVGTIDCARHDMKLPTGMADFCLPDRLHLDGHDKLVQFFIPKFHLKAHIQECQTAFSFNFSRGVRRTDGEAPERGWANINQVASSTKEMGLGARRDALDDHFGNWNWKKIMMMEIEEWKDDNTRANPFESQVIPLTQAATRLRLAEEEAQYLQTQVDMSLHAEVSLFIFISSGIDLEEQQYLQLLYIPAVAALRAAANNESGEMTKSEDYKLWLPSELSPETACHTQLRNIEWELWYAQAQDALNEVRRSIQLHAHLNIFKTANVRGQQANTQAHSALDHADRKKRTSSTRYMAAHQALEALEPLLGKVGWAFVLQPLNNSDMRYMGDMLDGQTKGTRNLSWIWKEVTLLQEEIRRVLAFLQWQVDWWLERAEARSFEIEADREGSRAYTERQAALQRAMREAFQTKWSVVPVLLMSEVQPPKNIDDTPSMEAPPDLDGMDM